MFCDVDCKSKQSNARECQHMQLSAKIHQNDAKIVQKRSPFWAIKHLFCLKKTFKIDVSTYESVQCEVCLKVSWVYFECFYALLWSSIWLLNCFLFVTFNLFWPLLGHFRPYLWLYRAIFGPFLEQGHFGVILDQFGGRSAVILGPLSVTFWSFSHRFGIVLVSFWPHFEAFLGYLPVWAIFGLFARFWAIFTVILRFLSDVLRSWLQN